MSKNQKAAAVKDAAEDKEPFLLSILPFAGLGLLLVVVLLLRANGGGGGGGGVEAAPDIEEEVSRMAVERWERESVQDLGLSEQDFALGPEDATVTIVEFSDFQCPYCRTSNVKTKTAFEDFPQDVRLVFKNYPLDTSCNDGIEQQLHPVACRAAVFARCAGRESPEKFWEVHDAMFSTLR